MIKIQGNEVASPKDIQLGKFDISKADRTAAGYMVMDIIRAGIRRVDVTWSYITDNELKHILDILDDNKPFFDFTFLDAGGYKTITAYVGDIMTSPWHEKNGVRMWKDVQIAFIEE